MTMTVATLAATISERQELAWHLVCAPVITQHGAQF